MIKTYEKFNPDYVVPPGVTLLENLDYLGMTQKDLAVRTGRPIKTINEIIKGKTAITPQTALQFERVLGIPASFWNNLEKNYREMLIKQEERESLQGQLEWLKQIPVKKMIEYNWINKKEDNVEQLQEVLNFFGVASIGSWNNIWLNPGVVYRKSKAFENHTGSAATWLRKGWIEGHKISCKSFDQELFKKTLQSIRDELTTTSPKVFASEIKKRCAEAGVAVVFVREMPGCPANGAACWLTQNKALIQLSLRFKTNDHLWFSFFHEAGHILLHSKKQKFIDLNTKEKDKLDQEADRFSSEILIPTDKLNVYLKRSNITNTSIRMFARELGIAPGIVVGRLQHEGLISFKFYYSIKDKFEWAN